MNKIVFIIPYFGKLPECYEMWRMSALRNVDFDFLFFTDIPDIVAEKNIYVERISFDELSELIQGKFDFKISLSEPYKLCDYKPAYGYIFERYISQYEFWGNCDIDIIWGNISKFITEDLLSNYDKIYEHGHLTIYRNTRENNQLFKMSGRYPEFNYQEVFASPDSFYFDEFYGMMLKTRRFRVCTYVNPKDFIDIDTKHISFNDVHDSDLKNCYFRWKNGTLYVIDGVSGKDREVLYAHFQKRHIDYSGISVEYALAHGFYIIPNMAIKLDDVVVSYKKDTLKYKLDKTYRHILDFVKRYYKARKQYGSFYQYYMSRQALKKRRRMVNEILKGDRTCW